MDARVSASPNGPRRRALGAVGLLLDFISRPRVVAVGLHLAPVTPRKVHKFQLDSVGIDEENRVVIFSVLRILGWSVEHFDLLAHKEIVKRLDVGPRARTKRKVMQAHAVAVEASAPICA